MNKEEKYKRHHDALRENLMKRKAQQRSRRQLENIEEEKRGASDVLLPLQTPSAGPQADDSQ